MFLPCVNVEPCMSIGLDTWNASEGRGKTSFSPGSSLEHYERGRTMRCRVVLGLLLFVASALLLNVAGSGASGCEPDGRVQFICGPAGAEDLVPVPKSDWVIASGLSAPGHLYLISGRDRSATVLFPTEPPRERPD